MKIKNMITIIMILAMIEMMTNKMISKKIMYINQNLNPIECEFEKMIKKNMPLSIKFFFIALLFMMFHVELALIMPAIQKTMMFSTKNWMVLFSMTMIILTLSLMMDWKNNMIKWF